MMSRIPNTPNTFNTPGGGALTGASKNSTCRVSPNKKLNKSQEPIKNTIAGDLYNQLVPGGRNSKVTVEIVNFFLTQFITFGCPKEDRIYSSPKENDLSVLSPKLKPQEWGELTQDLQNLLRQPKNATFLKQLQIMVNDDISVRLDFDRADQQLGEYGSINGAVYHGNNQDEQLDAPLIQQQKEKSLLRLLCCNC